MSGSGTLVTWPRREGLLDQLDLLLFPVVVGRGKRLFAGEGGQTGLTLTGRRRSAPGSFTSPTSGPTVRRESGGD